MDGWMDGWIHRWMDLCMHACISLRRRFSHPAHLLSLNLAGNPPFVSILTDARIVFISPPVGLLALDLADNLHRLVVEHLPWTTTFISSVRSQEPPPVPTYKPLNHTIIIPDVFPSTLNQFSSPASTSASSLAVAIACSTPAPVVSSLLPCRGHPKMARACIEPGEGASDIDDGIP